jgi:hypothetical protein
VKKKACETQALLFSSRQHLIPRSLLGETEALDEVPKTNFVENLNDARVGAFVA